MKLFPIHTFVLSLCLIVTISACGGPAGQAPPEVISTDSLGIAIRTYGHTNEQLEQWGHDPDPVLQIGAVDGRTPDVFGRVTSMKIDDEGGVVVTDALAGEIRSFSATSEHVGSVGGLGEGPGEFSNSVSLLRVAEDSIWAWDQRQQRVSVFADGAFAKSWNMPGGLVLSRALFVDSRVFAQSTMRLSGQSELPETGMNRPPVQFTVVAENGSSSRLFDTDGHERFLDIRLANAEITSIDIFQPPFARGAFFEVVTRGSDTRVIGGPNDRLVLHEWDGSGDLRVIHRYPSMDRSLTEAALARARQRILDRFDEPTPQMTQQLATLESNLPEYLPAFDRVWSDDESRLWLRRSAEGGIEEWLILALADLSPVARLVLPADFTLFDVRGGLLGGLWVDELGVPYVHVFRLRTAP